MADPRISHIELDEATILWRNADIEHERRVAIFDLLLVFIDGLIARRRQIA